MTEPAGSSGRPRVLIVGAGFGGLRAARVLRRAPVDLLLVDRNNYHLFQPLLYQVATAGLSPDQVAHPVRAIFRKQKNLEFRMVEVRGVDLKDRVLQTDREPLPYDFLILAMGARTDFFGLEDVARLGFGLKDVDDAVKIRNHVLRSLEEAMVEKDTARRRELLTFVVVGGGPTGVETAGALSELTRVVLRKDYPGLDPNLVRILLLEAADRPLAGMPEDLAEAAVHSLSRKQVEVRLGRQVEGYDGSRVRILGGEEIPARTLIWSAGVDAVELTRTIGTPIARQGRLAVEPSLQLAHHQEVYVIGDAAYLEVDGQPLPMMAPVAIQMGETAARNILRSLCNQNPLPLRYRNPGSLATIGRNSAVAYVHGLKFKGFVAWVVWLVVHLIQLIGFRNKIIVLVNWAWDYFFYERAVRLITPE